MKSTGGVHKSPAHVLAIPHPLQGHIIPMLRFTRGLACKGITISFVSLRFQISETDGKLVEFDWPVCISGLPTLRYHELNSTVIDDPTFFWAACEARMTSTGVSVNSFLELEEKLIEAFRSPKLPGDEHTKVPKIYPVGPLFSTVILIDTTSVDGSECSKSRCLLLLGSQPSSSVLYGAFGNLKRLLPEQIKELAHGLEASDQRFLW